jgi:hypothetical protein
VKRLSNCFTPDIISIDKLPNTFKSHAVRSSFDSLTFSILIAVICNYNATLFSKPFRVIMKVNIRILITLTDSPPLCCSAMPAGYDWSQLDMSGWDPNPSCIRTLGKQISETCNNMFRGQIHEAIQDTAHDILRCTPITLGTYAYLKTIVTGMPMPSYNGEDDLEVFMMWIHSLMCLYNIHQIVGPEHDHNRTTILHAALKDWVQTWYNMTIWTGTCGLHAFPPAFLMILLKLADTFVTPAAVMKAQHSFNKITYTVPILRTKA